MSQVLVEPTVVSPDTIGTPIREPDGTILEPITDVELSEIKSDYEDADVEVRDISYYQSYQWDGTKSVYVGIDWDVFASKVHYVIIKASEYTWYDKAFGEHVYMASAYGMPYGAYHFLRLRRPLSNAREQARQFFKVLSDPIGNYVPLDHILTDMYGNKELYLDCETHDEDFSRDEVEDYINIFDAELVKLSGSGINIYTSPGWWDNYVYISDIPRRSRLWVANWGVDSPNCPYDWNRLYGRMDGRKIIKSAWQNNPDMVRFWQYSQRGDGHAHGCTTKGLDMNRFNGSLADFNRLYKTALVPIGEVPPDPPIPPSAKKVEVAYLDNDERLNIREQVWGTVVGKARNGYVFDVVGTGKDADGRLWYKVNVEGSTGYFKPFWLAGWYAVDYTA